MGQKGSKGATAGGTGDGSSSSPARPQPRRGDARKAPPPKPARAAPAPPAVVPSPPAAHDDTQGFEPPPEVDVAAVEAALAAANAQLLALGEDDDPADDDAALEADLAALEGADTAATRPARRKPRAGDDDSIGDVELTDADLQDPTLLAGVTALEEREESDAVAGGDGDSDVDPLDALAREVATLYVRTLALADEDNMGGATAAAREACKLHSELKGLGADTTDPLPQLQRDCAEARQSALAHSKAGDKPAALGCMKRFRTLKGVLASMGVEVK